MGHHRLALPLALAALGVAAAPAAAETFGSAELRPNVAGKGATLVVDLTPPARKDAPTAVVLSIARGFKFDTKARAKRCTAAQAKSFDCPAKSRVGGGSATIEAGGLLIGGTRTYTAKIASFLAKPAHRGDIAGGYLQVSEASTGIQRSVPTRLVKILGKGRFGAQLRFDSLPAAPMVPLGITVRIARIELTPGAKRTTRKVRHRHGRRVVKKTRHNLIRNPKKCPAGGWPYELELTFAAGPQSYPGALACRKRS